MPRGITARAAARPAPRVARLLVWCDGAATVRGAFAAFTGALGMRPAAPPARRRSATWFALAGGQYHAAVTDGAVAVEFAAVDWISAARAATKSPPAQQLLAVCLKGVDPGVLEAAQPSFAQSACLLQQLAWIDQPACHPMIFLDPADAVRDDVDVDVDVLDEDVVDDEDPVENRAAKVKTHVKEIVFGEEEDRFYATSNLLRGLATRSVQPGVISFGASASYEDVVPALRVLPSSASALVLRVDDLAAFKSAAESSAASQLSFQEIPGRGRGADQLRVEAPFLSGLDVRLTDSDAIEASFVEATSTSMGDVGSVQFDRDDMGSISCRSANAMEVRTRFTRIPKEVLRRLGSHMRPQVR